MRSYRSELAVSVFLIMATLAAFWQLQNHDFINFDDDDYVTENPRVKAGLTGKTVTWAFTAFHSNNWHPLTWLSHALDCELFGLKPGMHHLINLLFHIANSILLFLLLRRMTGALWRSAFVAALFALHPLHVESVAWVSERKDMLGTFFWMLTMLAYIRYTKDPKLTRYIPVPLLFALGLMAKPMLVTLPCVLLLMDYWPLNRVPSSEHQAPSTKHQASSIKHQEHQASSIKHQASSIKSIKHQASSILEKVPLFALTVISCILTVHAQKTGGVVRSLELFPLSLRIGNAIVSYIGYMGKMFWPQDLAFYYPHPGASLPTWKALGAGLLLAGISVCVIRVRQKSPWLLIGWLWYLGTLVPVIGLVQVASQAMADRYTYIPLIGLFIMIAWGIPCLVGEWRHRRILFAVSAAVILLGCAMLTWFQVRHWKNSITLFTRTLSVTTDNYLANNSLGAALEDQGRVREAIRYFSEALRIKPDGIQAHYNMAVALEKEGRYEESARHLSKAVRLKPDFADARYNMGIAMKRQGNLTEAIRHFSEAVRIRPDFAEAHNNLGSALKDHGNHKEALVHYYKALRLKPDYAEAHNNLGTALKSEGRYKEAIRHYYQALRIRPEFPEALFNLGIALGNQGKHEEAAEHFSEAIRLKPDFAEAHYSLGVALTRQKKIREAMTHYETALKIRPEFADVHFNMGVLLAGKNTEEDTDAAVRHFQEAVRIKPDYAAAHNNLGSVLANRENFDEAVKHFSEAVRIKPDFADAQRNLRIVQQLMKKE
ncbi:tetratricopeptide repeat protein [Desulfobacterales bacterium HSG2]|nr:tetratricopeptide repeat protein [Desulfobacterales bacterium HSG2]